MSAYHRVIAKQTGRAAMRAIFRETAIRYGMTEADLYVRDRGRDVTAVRWEAWALCRDAGFTYAAIAKLAGWNHTGVAHGVDRYLNRQPRI